jgi:hypothetical protein
VSAAPDYVGTIRGWRVWLVAEIDDDARLVSVIYHVPWPVRVALAGECLSRELRFPRLRRRSELNGHAAPGEECACGIYAARELTKALDYLTECGTQGRRSVEGWPVLHRVLGRVHLWGTVVECDTGWRGARAYPARLFLPEHTWSGQPVDKLDRIALSLADYAIPIEILDGAGRQHEIEAALRTHVEAA